MRDFCRIANSVFNNHKFDIPHLFNASEVLSSASDKAKCFSLQVLQAPFLGPTLFISDLPDDVTCNIAICADDTTLQFDQASDLLQQRELASELESDLRDTVDLGK